jgi:hypothetical protein
MCASTDKVSVITKRWLVTDKEPILATPIRFLEDNVVGDVVIYTTQNNVVVFERIVFGPPHVHLHQWSTPVKGNSRFMTTTAMEVPIEHASEVFVLLSQVSVVVQLTFEVAPMDDVVIHHLWSHPLDGVELRDESC